VGWLGALSLACIAGAAPALAQQPAAPGTAEIGREVAVPRHLAEGEEFSVPLRNLLFHGRTLFNAAWTDQEGGGRPLSKGTGAPLADPSSPLVFPRNFNRVSAPDANSCAGCHNAPFGIPGGGGDIVTNVFVLGQRFDFVSFDGSDSVPTRGSVDESGKHATAQEISNFRNTPGMFGSGYIEMLARQMTGDLQALRDATPPGGTTPLTTKGVDFGVLSRGANGSWDVSGVEGLAAPSLRTSGPASPPSLAIRPFHQAGAVISLREFSNNAFNHHHGIQSTERFGTGTDPDGDGFSDEMTRADVTAAALFQAVLPVPGRVIPRDRAVERAVREGEHLFVGIGCADCHVPSLPLGERGWIFSEPNPYNPPGNLQPGEAPALRVDLSRPDLPGPRLAAQRGVVHVPAFTDLKLHDVTSGAGDPNREPLDMTHPAGSAAFFAGNGRFLTRKLWGSANEPPYFHHGQYTTLREATLAHFGEAETARAAFVALAAADQDAVIEFLKTLQVLPPGTKHLVVDERGHPRTWPSFPH
jgi:cytochrome c peroxidase